MTLCGRGTLDRGHLSPAGRRGGRRWLESDAEPGTSAWREELSPSGEQGWAFSPQDPPRERKKTPCRDTRGPPSHTSPQRRKARDLSTRVPGHSPQQPSRSVHDRLTRRSLACRTQQEQRVRTSSAETTAPTYSSQRALLAPSPRLGRCPGRRH